MKLDWEGAHARLRAAQDRLDEIDQSVGDFEQTLRARAEAIATALAAPPPVGVRDLVAFALGNQRFAVDAVDVAEVVKVAQITALPGVPSFYRGLITHRGAIYPLLDIRPFVGTAPTVTAKPAPFVQALLCTSDEQAIAIGVDEVEGIVRSDIANGPAGMVVVAVSTLLGDARLVVDD